MASSSETTSERDQMGSPEVTPNELMSSDLNQGASLRHPPAEVICTPRHANVDADFDFTSFPSISIRGSNLHPGHDGPKDRGDLD